MLNQVLIALLCGAAGLLGQDIMKWLWNRFIIRKQTKLGLSPASIVAKLPFPVKKWGIILAITLLSLGGIYGYAYWQGMKNKPINVTLSYESEFTIPSPDGKIALHKSKNSTKIQWIDLDTGRVISTVSVKDIPELAKALKPYGFKMRPFVCAGGSLGEKKAGFEGGAGLEFAHWFKLNINAWLTNIGIYIGPGYKVTNNFDIIAGVGKGYKGDNRVFVGGKWKF